MPRKRTQAALRPDCSSPDNQQVWHYTDANGLLGMIRDRSIWAGCTDFMNDEKEGVRGFEILRERWGKGGSETKEKTRQKAVEAYLKKVEETRSRQFIVSASSESDSLTLWRNYGRDSVSYAVCLDTSKRLVPVPLPKYCEVEEWPDAPDDYLTAYKTDVEDEEGRTHTVLTHHPDATGSYQSAKWIPVSYCSDEQITTIDEVALKIFNESSGQYDLFEGLHNSASVEQDLLSIKDYGFHHEEEVRLHYYGITPGWRFVHYRATSLGVTPYIVLTEASIQSDADPRLGQMEFEKSPRTLPVVAVRIGPTRYPKLAEKGLRSLLDENGFSAVTILHSDVPFR